MARWKLTAEHYLNVPGTRWEDKFGVTSKKQGAGQVYFDVPKHLDPKDPKCWNWRYDQDSGDCIVCYEGKGDPSGKDIVFVGPPTPDMLPLDDEAKAISAKMDGKWSGLNAEVMAEVSDPDNPMVNTMESRMTKAILTDLGAKLAAASVANQQASTGDSKAMDQLLATMNKMMEQNAQLIAVLAAQAQAQSADPAPRRR